MDCYAYRKFPDHRAAIELRMEKDASFRELLIDYEEICAWLAVHECQARSGAQECADARELRRDLEGEIQKMLEGSQ